MQAFIDHYRLYIYVQHVWVPVRTVVNFQNVAFDYASTSEYQAWSTYFLLADLAILSRLKQVGDAIAIIYMYHDIMLKLRPCPILLTIKQCLFFHLYS